MSQIPALLYFKWSGCPQWDFMALKESAVPTPGGSCVYGFSLHGVLCCV